MMWHRHLADEAHGLEARATPGGQTAATALEGHAPSCPQYNGRRRRGALHFYPSSSLTSDFSSFSSATDLSILSRLKSLSGIFCTISHLSPRTRTGNDEIKSFSTP